MNCTPDSISETACTVRGLVIVNAVSGGELAEDGYMHLPFTSLSRESIDQFNVMEIYTPALSNDFDCTDVARLLADSEFTGRLLIISDGFPDPCLIVQEVRSSFPSLLVELAETG
ncbi:hypothetical protein [Qingshengfaniella alkalisoli]|uniref:Uncharacterized protein n=1 Tax=Qingshengfaniella alkalisoli TaxID=2599296 RepID=A0A5B8J468_9RHOB|nr:hypothetical protein [Qingshengfaniella alkalisoli]QDY69060.1 hypothetical protein FPZ52_05060 [Qingshengfaniella alkalisoli]